LKKFLKRYLTDMTEEDWAFIKPQSFSDSQSFEAPFAEAQGYDASNPCCHSDYRTINASQTASP